MKTVSLARTKSDRKTSQKLGVVVRKIPKPDGSKAYDIAAALWSDLLEIENILAALSIIAEVARDADAELSSALHAIDNGLYRSLKSAQEKQNEIVDLTTGYYPRGHQSVSSAACSDTPMIFMLEELLKFRVAQCEADAAADEAAEKSAQELIDAAVAKICDWQPRGHLGVLAKLHLAIMMPDPDHPSFDLPGDTQIDIANSLLRDLWRASEKECPEQTAHVRRLLDHMYGQTCPRPLQAD